VWKYWSVYPVVSFVDEIVVGAPIGSVRYHLVKSRIWLGVFVPVPCELPVGAVVICVVGWGEGAEDIWAEVVTGVMLVTGIVLMDGTGLIEGAEVGAAEDVQGGVAPNNLSNSSIKRRKNWEKSERKPSRWWWWPCVWDEFWEETEPKHGWVEGVGVVGVLVAADVPDGWVTETPDITETEEEGSISVVEGAAVPALVIGFVGQAPRQYNVGVIASCALAVLTAEFAAWMLVKEKIARKKNGSWARWIFFIL
jgi:hypothetical protein